LISKAIFSPAIATSLGETFASWHWIIIFALTFINDAGKLSRSGWEIFPVFLSAISRLIRGFCLMTGGQGQA
jgi:hypothetical protein